MNATNPIDIKLPNTGFMKVQHVLQVIPVSEATWWQWVKNGKAPKSIKLSPRNTVWKVTDIREFIHKLEQDNE